MYVHVFIKKTFYICSVNVHGKMKKSINKKIGIKDIAELAGVSIGTVDRVIHNRGEVKEETRCKVMKIVEDFGYTPNILAKSLASKKTTRIIIVIPNSNDNNPYWKKPIEGIKLATDELLSYNTHVVFELFDASDADSFKRVLQDVIDKNPDGVVLNPVFKAVALDFIDVFDRLNIPYVFIDINLKNANNLGYFGQDAWQSGLVAAKLIDLSAPEKITVLIVKQSNKKIFSGHIEERIDGFMTYFKDTNKSRCFEKITVEIDLLNPNEPDETLKSIFEQKNYINSVFVPNSRGFKLADFLDRNNIKGLITVGYDLISQNVNHLKNEFITYLISQKPEEQAYKAIWALFYHLSINKEVHKTNYSAIDIIVKENIDYYYQ